ncbi:hypothetical protein [Pseudomonas sp. BN102]|uniref:hypothetical protein n=1 Tax=Pseudomonas sp. BN102 TaxID=2567886 RepID=UPI0024539301|nr:hypothetical protein [Pseudomonas sp. BN102]MDH4609950.1 hypothetical protein [Pseudomonas sp. BN102]
MTDEADSHTPDTVDTAVQKPDSSARRQRTHALYHFLDKVDAIIQKRSELQPPRQAGAKAPGEEPLPLEMQTPPSFDRSITPRGDDELTDLGPVAAPRR